MMIYLRWTGPAFFVLLGIVLLIQGNPGIPSRRLRLVFLGAMILSILAGIHPIASLACILLGIFLLYARWGVAYHAGDLEYVFWGQDFSTLLQLLKEYKKTKGPLQGAKITRETEKTLVMEGKGASVFYQRTNPFTCFLLLRCDDSSLSESFKAYLSSHYTFQKNPSIGLFFMALGISCGLLQWIL